MKPVHLRHEELAEDDGELLVIREVDREAQQPLVPAPPPQQFQQRTPPCGFGHTQHAARATGRRRSHRSARTFVPQHTSRTAKMEPMRFAALLLFSGLWVTAQAGVLYEYEGFDYPAGSSIYLQNGGSGWSGAWGTPGGLDATIAAASLNGGGLATTGGALTDAAFQPPGQGSSVATWVRYLGTPLGTDGATAYMSFLFRPEAGYGFYGGVNFGGIFVGLSGNQLSYGLEGPGGALALSNVAATAGETVLLVLRVDFAAGNDALKLYLNPLAGAAEPGAASVTKSDLDIGNVDFLTINNYGGFTIDEIRIGSSFDAVTPLAPVPEPALGWAAGLALAAVLRFSRRRP